MSHDRSVIGGGLRRGVGRALRGLGADLDRLDQVVADRFGLHRTDLACLEIVGRAGPLPAGRLAAAAGLSTSAVTAVIDRTERAGYVRRSADPADRRRVLVELTEVGRECGRAAFSGLAKETDRMLGDYTDAQLELLDRFLAQARAIIVEQARIAVDLARSGVTADVIAPAPPRRGAPP